ncbi:serine O-acetyltransferase [Buchnera aphidicola]|uniref:serine O-acetyltransferase n=1 Tax=Buchnera aphidicola TaxID=9 RepID=UPI0031B86A9B
MYEDIEKKFWLNIKYEVNKLIKEESILYNFYFNNILKHKNFINCISYILSKKIDNKFLSSLVFRKLIKKILLKKKSLIYSIIQDIKFIYNNDPVVKLYIVPLLYFKGFHALQIYRISNYLWVNKRKSLALYLQNQISNFFSIDIHPAAIIGSGIFLDHATGIVIGETTIIHNNVFILQGVTLGSVGKNNNKIRHPKICEGVFIGAGAKILGNITIGSFSKVGAGAVVLSSVLPYSTVVGIPAKKVIKV